MFVKPLTIKKCTRFCYLPKCEAPRVGPVCFPKATSAGNIIRDEMHLTQTLQHQLGELPLVLELRKMSSLPAKWICKDSSGENTAITEIGQISSN